MYRLIEVTYTNNKESQAIYPHDDAVTLEADFETKLGQAMLNNTDELLICLDNIGKVVKGSNDASLSAKHGTHSFSPRLYECKTSNTEEADVSKYDDENTLHARFHTKKGAAMNDVTVKQEVLFGFVNDTQVEYCQWVRPVEPQTTSQPEQTPEEPTE